MSESIDSLIAQAYEMPAGVGMVVDDTIGAGRALGMTTGWYRTWAAQGNTGAGTEANPYELLFHLRQVLDSGEWNVSLLPTGHVRITYLGLAAGGAITWGSSVLPNLLGFLTDFGPVATGQHQDAEHLPTHCVFFGACDDSGWTRTPGRASLARMPSGKVYGWADRQQTLTRRLVLKLLPKDNATRDALIVEDSNAVPPTPCFGPMTRVNTPYANEPGQALPWGAIETFATAGARSLGVMIGTLQTSIGNPSGAPFDHCFLTPETITAGAGVRLSVELYDPRRDIAAVDLSFVAAETR